MTPWESEDGVILPKVIYEELQRKVESLTKENKKLREAGARIVAETFPVVGMTEVDVLPIVYVQHMKEILEAK